jgi:hypothetical protein
MSKITESHVETATIEWLKELGYTYIDGPTIAPVTEEKLSFSGNLGYPPERTNYSIAILPNLTKRHLKSGKMSHSSRL